MPRTSLKDAVKKASHYYWKTHLDHWSYCDFSKRSSLLIFWYAAAGQPLPGEGKAWEWVDLLKAGQAHKLPALRQRAWKSIQLVSSQIRKSEGLELVPWIISARAPWRRKWEELQEIYLIGPKIASWILRDLSLLLDYATVSPAGRLSYRSRRLTWFAQLTSDEQAYFIPIDQRVFSFAKQNRILTGKLAHRSPASLWTNSDRYLQACTRIIEFALQRDVDPRELDQYWYLLGAGWIKPNGNPT